MFTLFEFIKALLLEFRGCFTSPSFLLFEMIVLTFLSRICSDASLVQVWRWQHLAKHWTNLHRLVRLYNWSSLSVANQTIRLLLRLFPDGEELYFVADTTDVERYSKKLPGVCRLWSVTLKRFVHAQRWLVISIIKPRDAGFSSFRCFGILPLLWTGTTKVTTLLKETMEKFQLPLKFKRYLIVDAGFSSVIPSGFELITRLRIDARVFLPPPLRRINRRGRPRKKGDREYLLSIFYRSRKRSIMLYRGQKMEVVVKRGLLVAQWGYRRALLLICRPLAHPDWRPAVIATTDVEMEPQRLLSLYGARTEIETLFQDIKTKAGFGKYRGNSQQAQQRFSQLVLIAQSINQIVAQKYPIDGIDLNELWRKKKNGRGFSQNQLRRILWSLHIANNIFHFFYPASEVDKNHPIKEQIFMRLCKMC